MPNAALKDNLYNDGNDNKEKYTALAMQESRLKKAKARGEETGDWSEFHSLGGEVELKRLETIIHTAQDANYNAKDIARKGGKENAFQKQTKPTASNIKAARVTKNTHHAGPSVKNKIMTNTEALSEAITKEITDIKYLIEYMNNNNKKQNL